MDIIAIKHNDQIFDLQTAQSLGITGEEIAFDNSADSLEIIRHSCAHLLAEAVKSLYTDAKFFVGPVVKEGFYYDFKVNESLSEEDLKTIEKKMLDIAKTKEKIERYEITKEEARSKFAGITSSKRLWTEYQAMRYQSISKAILKIYAVGRIYPMLV